MKARSLVVGRVDDEIPDPATLWLQLFVSGATPRSSRAIANITAIGETWLNGDYVLEVIDAFQQSDLVREQQVVVLPTLIRRSPLPRRRLIGDLSDRRLVLLGLGLDLDEPGDHRPDR
jgi:circadian clock protein KaiB